MKIYDFNNFIDRAGSNSAKFDETYNKFGEENLISMWIADMDYKVADPIIEALNKRVNQGVFGYTSRPKEYFEAVANWQSRINNWSPNTDNMSYATGVLPMLSNIFHSFLNKGDRVIIQPPVFQEFKPVIECWGGVVVENPLIERYGDYNINFVELDRLASQGAKFLILCHPHNPIGRVWTKEELLEVGRICSKYNVMVISDEIYSDLMLFGNKHIPFASLSDEFAKNTITCTSASKTFNLSGLQMATVILPNIEMKQRYDEILYKNQTYRNNAFNVVANTVAMTQCDDWYKQVIQYIESNVKYACDFINNNINGLSAKIPEATYLIWLDCRDLKMNGEELNSFMIKKAKLALNEGRIFGTGGEGFMRLNAGCSKQVLDLALKQLKLAVDEYNLLNSANNTNKDNLIYFK